MGWSDDPKGNVDKTELDCLREYEEFCWYVGFWGELVSFVTVLVDGTMEYWEADIKEDWLLENLLTLNIYREKQGGCLISMVKYDVHFISIIVKYCPHL